VVTGDFRDDDLCTERYSGPGMDFGLMCNEVVEHDGDHRALAEVGPDIRRFVSWPREAYGHEPFSYDGVLWCRRCWTIYRGNRELVPWPCTSARVLGLVPRDGSLGA
jgi:hypothetical protein